MKGLFKLNRHKIGDCSEVILFSPFIYRCLGGNVWVSYGAAREGRNPQTGKTIRIAGRKVVKFKASPELNKTGTGDGGPRNK